MAQIDFKSVGVRTATFLSQSAVPVANPIGIKTPMTLGKQGEGIFAMHTRLEDQIHDNLRNLLLTNHGERLGLFDMGANLRPLAMELATADFDSEAVVRIKTAVAKYMPFVDLQTFESKIDHVDNEHVAKIKIYVAYSIPTLSIFNKILEVTIYAGG